MDPSCLSDYDPTDLTTILDCAGRLTMAFNPPCIPIAESREVAAEFIDVGCGELGDVNSDGGYDVLDVVDLVLCVLSQTCADEGNIGCAGDVNADGNYNIVDVVNLVNCVLAQNCEGALGRVDAATNL